MGPKKLIIGAIENWAGEYIPTVSRENLSVGLVRGRIKLTDVPLDGDLIGSHVLGAATGLTGYGVLSCHARELRISIPWGSLEKEPTKFELRGVHLVCVPLAPGTASRTYGSVGSGDGTGSTADDEPRCCALRTRAKRAALARLERNFFAGRIPGEGPPPPRERKGTKTRSSSRGSGNGGARRRRNRSGSRGRGWRGGSSGDGDAAGDGDAMARAAGTSSAGGGDAEDDSNDGGDSNGDDDNDDDSGDGPSSRQNSNSNSNSWGARLRAKIFRNVEMSVSDLHIRCEVPEGGLLDEMRRSGGRPGRKRRRPGETGGDIGGNGGPPSPSEQLDDDQEGRAFAFGLKLGSVVVRTARDGEWDAEDDDDALLDDVEDDSPAAASPPPNRTTAAAEGDAGAGGAAAVPPSSTTKGECPGPETRSRKVMDLNDMSVYWDDSPPVLISESDLLIEGGLAPHKVHRRVAAAMEALRSDRDPGDDVLGDLLSRGGAENQKSPAVGGGRRPSSSDATPSLVAAALSRKTSSGHAYCCRDLSLRIQATLIDRGPLSPSRCLARLLPCRLDVDLRPYQCAQYSRLRTAMFAQRRLDTMLHRRPERRPDVNPAAWWRYAIACVVARPHWRPWRDVKKIGRVRPRYLELVARKLTDPSSSQQDGSGNGGRNGGLSEREAQELLRLEESLPIEALLAFHLLALRRVVATAAAPEEPEAESSQSGRRGRLMSARSSSAGKPTSSVHRTRSSLSRIRRKLVGGGGGSGSKGCGRWPSDDGDQFNDMEEHLLLTSSASSARSLSRSRTESSLDDDRGDDSELQMPPPPREDAALANEAEPMQLAFRADSIAISARLLKGGGGDGNGIGEGIARIEAETSGTVRSLGGENGRKDLVFDVASFEAINLIPKSRSRSRSEADTGTDRILTVGGAAAPRIDAELGDLQRGYAEQQRGRSTDKGPTHLMPKLRRQYAKDTNAGSSEQFALRPHQHQGTDKQGGFDYGGKAKPTKVVCSVAASIDRATASVSISADPATLLWDETCLNALSDFFSEARGVGTVSPERRSVLGGQLRNAATPLAHRAQLALMAPLALTVRMNVDAPKLWVPVSSSPSRLAADGAMFLDAGRIKLNLLKPEGLTQTTWDVFAREMQVKFVRGIAEFGLSGEAGIVPRFSSSDSSAAAPVIAGGPVAASNEISVVRPFQINVVATLAGEKEKSAVAAAAQLAPGDDYSFSNTRPLLSSHSAAEERSTVSVTVGDLDLNLADVDTLASAIGKWYAAGVLRVKERRVERPIPGTAREPVGHGSTKLRGASDGTSQSLPLELTVSAKKVEMMLECCSKGLSAVASRHDRVIADRRTYLISLCGIEVGLDAKRELRQTSTYFTLEDARVVQMADGVSPTAQGLKPSMESRHQVLVRTEKRGGPTHAAAQGSFSSPEAQPQPQTPPLTPKPPQREAVALETSSFGYLPTTPGRTDASSLYTAAATSPSRAEDPPILRFSYLHDGLNHLDEIEILLEPFAVRVTPTSLKDFVRGLRRVVDLGRLVTAEMERKIHEEGRSARRGRGGHRQRCHDARSASHAYEHARPASPGVKTGDASNEDAAVGLDSSLLFRLTVKEAAIIAGRPMVVADDPMSPFLDSSGDADAGPPTDAVIQVLYSALIMFQSVENADSSGSKTLHISADNLSTSIITSFEGPVPPSEVPPSMGPTAAEFRVVYGTVNQGVVISQDLSIDCESLKSCATPSDIAVLNIVIRVMTERLKKPAAPKDAVSFESEEGASAASRSVASSAHEERGAKKSFASLLQFKKKGTGIATSVRFELQSCSFVLLRPLASHGGVKPLFDVNTNQMKGKLDGCLSALSGECSSLVSVDFYNCDTAEWEYAIEPFDIVVAVEQMPNEITLSAATPGFISMNFTGALLSKIADVDFDSSDNASSDDSENAGGVPVTPTSVGKHGQRRSSELHSISLKNTSGLDLIVYPVEFDGASGRDMIKEHHSGGGIPLDSGGTLQLDSYFGVVDLSSISAPVVALGLAATAANEVGQREMVLDLPVLRSKDESISIHRLVPLTPTTSEHSTQQARYGGGATSDCRITGGTLDSSSSPRRHDIEPVVEWCMQNQRLRSTTSDVYSLEKGKDVLSSSVWSPGDESITDNEGADGQSYTSKRSNSSYYLSSDMVIATTPRTVTTNWLKPYLNNDSPEWTDMTCTLKMVRDRVMLPDNNWIWASDWLVDLSGSGSETDADGWEYETDFDAFGRSRRFYKRGDLVRRRRWTRTRMMKPPKVDDPKRPLSFVWETQRDDDNGSFSVTISSHVTLHNRTSVPLSFFVHCYSWESEMIVGTVEGGKDLPVPAVLASGTYLRLASLRSDKAQSSCSLKDYRYSDRLMIVPTSYTSSVLLRTSMRWGDKRVGMVENTSNPDMLHFLVHIKTVRGKTDIYIDPALRVMNLLPCSLRYQLGETIQTNSGIASERKVVKRVEGGVEIGKMSSSGAIDPKLKPHISLRVPGYKWTTWQRIVNRKANSHTWQPPLSEEDILYQANKEDVDHADEYKTVVRFERLTPGGDPLHLILSVEMGHCPTLRIYSQYWIMDKTGFGLRFVDGFKDLLRVVPVHDFSRRSYLESKESKNTNVKKDMLLPGHQWSLGMSGMSLYYSKKERLAISIECGVDDLTGADRVKSKWTAAMDVSNVMLGPKTVFSVDEYDGPRRFELSLNVRLAPSLFSRTKFITLFPRYSIYNLLPGGLFVAQEGCLSSETFIPSQSCVPFHWEESSRSPKIRLCMEKPSSSNSSFQESTPDDPWTNGSIQLDKIGITSMRLPGNEPEPDVMQVEVRLASDKQSSAVVVLIWSTSKSSNPLYLLRNRSSQKILCSQPLSNDTEDAGASVPDDLLSSYDGCSSSNTVLSRYEGCSSADTPKSSNNLAAARVSSLRRLRKNRVSSTAEIDERKKQDESAPALGFECGIIKGFGQAENRDEYVWELRHGQSSCFGFDDPERPHILEWTSASCPFDENITKTVGVLDVDALGSSSTLLLPGGSLMCQIKAEHSTKVIEFVDVMQEAPGSGLLTLPLQGKALHYQSFLDKSHAENAFVSTDAKTPDDEYITFTLRLDLPGITVSVVDNAAENAGREILLLQAESWMVELSQSQEGYRAIELSLMSLQVDNHAKSIHPVLVFCPRLDEREPFLHLTAVRRLQPHSSTYVFRYVALRVLAIDIFLDRLTAERIALFIRPLWKVREERNEDPQKWIEEATRNMTRKYAKPDRRAPRDIEQAIHTANSGRVYVEQLVLHPIRLSLTFTQEWMDWNPATEGLILFQFIRGMASIANAPLVFTSFLASHAFEAPQSLFRIISAHYSSQLSKQIFAILGSLAILNGPADFLTNVGTGVRDFFYEPINGIMYGPAQFIEGLETGAQSLARGVFVGVVKGVSNVTEVVNSNLAAATADDAFVDERAAHQRLLTDALSRGQSRTVSDSLYLASASVARGVKSGAMGIVEQPAIMSSKHGPVGFMQGIAKALVGVVVKPVVGIGDAAVLVMNHAAEATSQKEVVLKIPKRLRRALPRKSADERHIVMLVPFDEKAAKAQRIVTGNESIDDVYMGHVNIPSYLIIASEQCLWAIDRHSRDPWCLSWEEISHFRMDGNSMQVTYFSPMYGLMSHVFDVASAVESVELYNLLSMQVGKMGNSLNKCALGRSILTDNIGQYNIPGIKSQQVNHVFGSCNSRNKRIGSSVKDEIDVIEQCFARVKELGSELPTFFKSLDEEAWSLVNSWGQVFSGLSSRRCLSAGFINGTGGCVQIKSTKLMEGGSPIYTIPSKEYDHEQGILYPGGAIILFSWGAVPNLVQAGRVFMSVETNVFVCELADRKSNATYALPLPGFQVGFVEKSFDPSDWWAKYWLLIRKT